MLSGYDLNYMTVFSYKENADYGVQKYSKGEYNEKLLESKQVPDALQTATLKGMA